MSAKKKKTPERPSHDTRLREVVLRRRGETWDLVTDRGPQNGETHGGFESISECVHWLLRTYGDDGEKRPTQLESGVQFSIDDTTNYALTFTR